MDGKISEGGKDDSGIYHSELEIQLWFQMEFMEPTIIKAITFTNRRDGNGERFHNVAIHVGNHPAVLGAPINNPVCQIFKGPSTTRGIEHISCRTPLKGRYLQIQMREPTAQYLQINEITVTPTPTRIATKKYDNFKITKLHRKIIFEAR
jgi:hypothetical protein